MTPACDDRLARAYARSFSGPEGARVLAHLKAITQGRALSPEASCAELRHLEGQRHLVRFIAAMVARGGGAPATPQPGLAEGEDADA